MRILRLSVVLAAAALAGCSSMKIQTEFDPKAQYDAYKTYAWIPVAPGPEQAAAIRNPQVHARVVQAVDREMARKGLVLTSMEANPDFLVSVLGWSRQSIEVMNYGYAYGTGYAYGPSMAVAMPVASVREYTDGTLVLDFVDAATKKLVWRGIASDAIHDPEEAIKVVDEAARRLLEAYPPKKQ